MKKRWWIVAGVGLAALLGGSAYAMRVADQASVAAAAMAKVVCSCVFIDGRPLEACRVDDPPGFEEVPVVIDERAKVATARVLGVITRRATYSKNYGCILEP